MTHDERINLLKKYGKRVYVKGISSGRWRIWVGDFDPSKTCIVSSIPGIGNYFTSDADTEFDAVQDAYWKLYDFFMSRCNVSIWDRM